MLNEVFKWISNRFLFIITLIFGILAFVYRTPQEQQSAISNFFINKFGIYGMNIQTSFDVPSSFVWLFIIITFILLIDSVFIGQKAFHSDYCFMEGADYNGSCIGANLKVVGEWAWLRLEGIKEFPIEGNVVACNLATHTHRVGNHIVMEGHVIPKESLINVPMEVKFDVRQRRSGIFGVNTSSSGYITTKELRHNREFKTDDYAEHLKPEEKGKVFQTQAFIDSIRDLNRDLNAIIEFNSGERESLTKFLVNTVGIGKDYAKAGGDGSILDRVMGK